MFPGDRWDRRWPHKKTISPILSHAAAMRYLGLKAGWQGPLLVFGVLFVDVVFFCSKKLYDIGGNRMTADSHGLLEDINGLLFSTQAKYMLDLFCYFQEWFQYVFLLLRMSEEEPKLNTAARIVAVGVEFATSSRRSLFSLLTQQHKACMRKSWVVLSQESGPSLFFGGLPVPRSSTSIRSM